MTARSRVLEAYGQCCAWCQTTQGPFELDHIVGGGKEHRAVIKMPIADWLISEHRRTGRWSSDLQLLCLPCHWRKTSRQERQAMPTRKGAVPLNISPATTSRGSSPSWSSAPEYGSKSAVIELALRRLMEGAPEESALDGLHQHVATVGREMHKAVAQMQERLERDLPLVEQALDALSEKVDALGIHVTHLAQQQTAQHRTMQGVIEAFKHELTAAYDRMKERLTTTRRHWWS